MISTARVVWFVHRPDEACLYWSVVQAKTAFPEGTTFHVFADGLTGGLSESARSWLRVSGIEYQETRWERGGNLNGFSAVDGILTSMHGVARDRGDVVWKIDADTLVSDPSVLLAWFSDPEVIGAGLRCPWAAGWWGISYALRAGTIPRLALRVLDIAQFGMDLIGLTEAHEDLVISRALAGCEAPARLRTWMTRRTGGAFCAHNYQTGADPRQALHKWGIVTFGNRWQIEGEDAHRRQIVADSMQAAAAEWTQAGAQAWRSGSTERLWAVGSLLQFGKSSKKGAQKAQKVA